MKKPNLEDYDLTNKFSVMQLFKDWDRYADHLKEQLNKKLFDLARYYEMTTSKAEVDDLKNWIKNNPF